MRPGEALAEVLAQRGVKSVASLVAPLNARFRRNPFQETAVHMLVHKSKINTKKRVHAKRWFLIRTRYGAVEYMWRGGEELSESLHEWEGEVGVEDFIDLVDRKPLIVLYLGFYYIHTEREKRKLKLQVHETLSAVRTFLWDLNMVLVEPSPLPPELVPSPHVNVVRSMEEIDAKKIILMDPNAEEELSPEEVLEAEAFVFGGIVDKEVPRIGLTSLIPCDKPRCLRRKVTLRGSVYGVPAIVHKLVYALLRARYELRGNLEEAIIEVMSSKEKRWRMAKELIEARRRGEDVKEKIIEVGEWLRMNEKDLIHSIKMSGLNLDSRDIEEVLEKWRSSK
ncbi:hypothetical protein IPA_09575 [Ignicoccus pacificus DSM 13166]|uniref:SAM-dependent MTase TRM10-type domain-containing protein n=1 Tax=Ignicoccus pacificus DSM 13166 TaxID=940294 RepID=A0A977KC48_9CREN|nr:hypothetical protein IPA_09575 [Ignicoccus pacificus DSM 13166]